MFLTNCNVLFCIWDIDLLLLYEYVIPLQLLASVALLFQGFPFHTVVVFLIPDIFSKCYKDSTPFTTPAYLVNSAMSILISCGNQPYFHASFAQAARKKKLYIQPMVPGVARTNLMLHCVIIHFCRASLGRKIARYQNAGPLNPGDMAVNTLQCKQNRQDRSSATSCSESP